VRHFAVIPTVGERNATLVPMVNRLLTDGVYVIVVENGGRAIPTCELIKDGWLVLTHDWIGEPVNLSKIWNMGLDWAHELAAGEDYVVAVFNDDLTLPPQIVQHLEWAIVNNDAAAAFAASPGVGFVARHRDPLHLGNRMCGFAFALLGSKNLRADENFLWWWGDTDLDLQAREAGGVVGVHLAGLEHHDPNGYTNRNPALYEQAGRDREMFQRKWNFVPW